MTTSSDSVLPAIELQTGDQPVYAIIWMHGLGADGNDLVPFVNQLALPDGKHVRFIFPHAPMRPVSINGGSIMRAWHDYVMAGPDSGIREDMVSLRESQWAIDAFITREQQRGIDPGNVVLAGFSQGGALALQTGLRHPKKIAGVIALSCYLPASQALKSEANPANARLPIFMAHGKIDNVIPMGAPLSSKRLLLDAGYRVEWHEYPMAHTVCAQEIDDIGEWLKQVML